MHVVYIHASTRPPVHPFIPETASTLDGIVVVKVGKHATGCVSMFVLSLAWPDTRVPRPLEFMVIRTHVQMIYFFFPLLLPYK